nr:MAG TPA: WzzE-like protein [Caudoviricetes sp.]
MLLALSAVSCRSVKTATRESSTAESHARRETTRQTVSVARWQQRVTVPESRVTLSVAEDSLALLPAGAGYTARRGQAHVKVSRRPTTDKGSPARIIIEAGCDSLEVQCARYEQRIEEIQAQLSAAEQVMTTQKEVIKTQQPWSLKRLFTAFIVGLAAGIVLTILIRKKIWQKVF